MKYGPTMGESVGGSALYNSKKSFNVLPSRKAVNKTKHIYEYMVMMFDIK